MSNRTIVELNHDYSPRPEKLQEWAEAIKTYLRSGDKSFLPQGVTFISMRHHSEPSTIPTVRELALSRLSVKYQEDGKWRINYTMQNGSVIAVVNRHSAEMAIAQIAGIVADMAESLTPFSMPEAKCANAKAVADAIFSEVYGHRKLVPHSLLCPTFGKGDYNHCDCCVCHGCLGHCEKWKESLCDNWSKIIAAYGVEREKPLHRGFVNLYEIATGQKATFDERVGIGMATSAVDKLRLRVESSEAKYEALRKNSVIMRDEQVEKARTEERQRASRLLREEAAKWNLVPNYIEKVALAIEADAPIPVAQKVSRTYGELPESVRNLIAPHEWDNKNITEQRDWALSILAEIQDADYALNVDRAWKKRKKDTRNETLQEILDGLRSSEWAAQYLAETNDMPGAYHSWLQSKLESMLKGTKE